MRALELAQAANTNAQAALVRLDAHEKHCTERWQVVVSLMNDVKRGVEGLYRRWWGVVGSVVVLLLAIIGYFLAKHGL